MKQGSIPDATEAARGLSERAPTLDALPIVTSLAAGLTLLRDHSYQRIHFDVEEQVGQDSMLVPLSEKRAYEQTREVIEVYLVVESAWEAQRLGIPAAADDWFLGWLGEFRLGERARLSEIVPYRKKSPDARRRAFMDGLMKVLPESSRAPLVLYRLFPLAIHVATALAFGHHPQASMLRAQQVTCLPPINECPQCQGALLENGESCATCGNPLWKYQWLIITD
jgi:hypothetical protein